MKSSVIVEKLYITFYPEIRKNDKTYSFVVNSVSFFEKSEDTSNRTKLDRFINKMISNYKGIDNEKKLLKFFFELADRSKLFLIYLYTISFCLDKQKSIEWNEIKENSKKFVKELKHLENNLFYSQINYPQCEKKMKFHIDKAKCSAYNNNIIMIFIIFILMIIEV